MNQLMSNRMQCIGYLFWIAFYSYSLNAQPGTYQLKASPPIEVQNKHESIGVYGYGNNGIIHFLKWNKDEYVFQKFSQELKLLSNKTVSTKDLISPNLKFNNFVKLKNRSYFFFNEVLKKEKCEEITAVEFSPEDLDFTGSSKNLFKSSGSIRYQVGEGFDALQANRRQIILDNIPSYELLVSKDRSKFMYYYTLKHESKIAAKNKEVMGFHVFDENLKKLWGLEYEMPYTEKLMERLDYLLSDDGRLYIVARVFSNANKDETNGKNNYHYEIFMFEQGKQVPKVVKMETGNNFLLEARLLKHGNNDVMVAGYYGIVSQYGGPARGVYTIRPDFSETLGDKDIVFTEFPKDVIDTSYGKEQPEEKKKGVYNLRLENILYSADGSIYLIGEKSYSLTIGDNSKSYAFGLYPAKINSSGRVEWIRYLPKKQMSPNTSLLSFASFSVDSTVCIFYLPDESKIKSYILNADGTFKEKNISDIGKYESHFYIRYFSEGLDHENPLLGICGMRGNYILFSIREKRK